MLWIFDQLAEGDFLSTNDAIAKLKLLVSRNIIYQNYAKLVKTRGINKVNAETGLLALAHNLRKKVA